MRPKGLAVGRLDICNNSYSMCHKKTVMDRIQAELSVLLYNGIQGYVWDKVFDPVVTTKLSSIYEVIQGKALYADDPFDAEEWISKINETNKLTRNVCTFKEHELKNVFRSYENMLHEEIRL